MVLFFLSFCLLCRKLKEFWQAPENEYEEFFECFAVLSLNGHDVVDPRDAPLEIKTLNVASSSSCTKGPVAKSSLVGGVPDVIVHEVLWTKFTKPPSISLMLRLRRLTKNR